MHDSCPDEVRCPFPLDGCRGERPLHLYYAYAASAGRTKRQSAVGFWCAWAVQSEILAANDMMRPVGIGYYYDRYVSIIALATSAMHSGHAQVYGQDGRCAGERLRLLPVSATEMAHIEEGIANQRGHAPATAALVSPATKWAV
jgi:hypothetical protein